MKTAVHNAEVTIPIGSQQLGGELIPAGDSLVLFAHGSGSSRHSVRNQYVASVLREAGVGTLLFDLLTPGEEEAEYFTRHLRFNIDLLADRLVGATEWAFRQGISDNLRVGYFGSSTGAAAALVAAAHLKKSIGAVVSRGGRPDLASAHLSDVAAPVLLIVGNNDAPVVELNEQAYAQLRGEKEFKLIPGATHLFEEPGALQAVATLAADWFAKHLQP